MYKIATWNLERPKYGSLKTTLAIAQIRNVNADILVLTETSDAVDLTGMYPFCLKTTSFERASNEQWVTIWSKWKIIKQIKTLDGNRTVSGVIKTPFGNISIYGTIIPYHQAGVSGVRYGNLNYRIWEYHEKDLYAQGKDWENLIDTEENPVWVIGDFNQSRFENKGYGTRKVRQILTEILTKLQLKCITEIDFSGHYLSPDPKKGTIRKNIDHICVSEALLSRMSTYEVGAWDHFTAEGQFMSDHNGVYITFKI